MKRTCLIICLATLATLMPLGEKAAAQDTVDNSSFILTPPAPDTPKVNGPKVYGERPGAPLMYRIPATGVRPIRFSAKGLPKGLKLDAGKGIISGKVCKKGSYKVIAGKSHQFRPGDGRERARGLRMELHQH